MQMSIYVFIIRPARYCTQWWYDRY